MEMTKTVAVLRRESALKLTPDEETCLISIWSSVQEGYPGYSDSPPMTGWKDVLRLDFDDIVSPPPEGIPYNNVIFTEEMAAKTVDFIKKYDGSPFIVHCDAGISRSVAVGSFMEQAFGYTADYVAAGERGDQFRNVHVVSLLKRQLWNPES